jgi:hypothetical protein
MRKMFYKIMISSIYTAQNNGFMSDIWKFTSGFYFSFATSIYLLFVFFILNNFVIIDKLDFLILDFTSKRGYNFIFNMTLFFIVPCMVLCYISILRKNNYKKLIKQYKSNYNKKIFAWYFSIAIACMFVILFLKPDNV